MSAQIAFNPYITTNAAGSFNVSSTGYIAGMLLQNPVENFKIAGGVVGSTETIPMWGGIGITESIPVPGYSPTHQMASLGGILTRATTEANLTGFTVFDQSQSLITTPQSPVPQAGSGNTINMVRLGSNVRLAVACDASLSSIEGDPINQQVSWDFNAQALTAYDAATGTVVINSAVWANTNGGRLTIVANAATLVGAVGDYVTISGATNTGTGGAPVINTTFQVDTFTDNEHFTLAAPAAVGVFGTIAGSPVVVEGTVALACKVLSFNFGNSMVPIYNVQTGFVTWNRTGSCAVIII